MEKRAVIAKLVADVAEFRRGMEEAEKGMDDLGNTTENVDKKMQSFDSKLSNFAAGLSNVGKKMSLFITTPLVAIGAASISTASEVEEMQGKFDVVFGGLKDGVQDWADEHANAIGRSKYDMRGYLAETQNQLVGMGMAREKAAEFSKQIVELGVDLASFNNEAEDRSLDNMISSLVGNHNASRSLGAILNENTLQMAMQKMGIQDTFQALNEATKMQVRYTAIMMQSKDAIGDAERTAGSYANRMRALKGAIHEFRVEVGQHLLPAATALVEIGIKLIRVFTDLPNGVQQAVVIFGAFLAVLGPAMLMISTLINSFLTIKKAIKGLVVVKKAWIAVQTALNVALTANPVGIIIMAIAALVGIIALIIHRTVGFRKAWEGVVNFFRAGFNVIGSIIRGIASFFTTTLPRAVIRFVEFITAPMRFFLDMLLAPIRLLAGIAGINIPKFSDISLSGQVGAGSGGGNTTNITNNINANEVDRNTIRDTETQLSRNMARNMAGA